MSLSPLSEAGVTVKLASAREMQRLALAGLPRILAEPDMDPIAVLLGSVAQQALDIARLGLHSHQIERVVAADLSRPSLIPTVQSGSLRSVFSVAARSQ